ncbi:hypothetical protein L1049_026492 [Liquidambar formosana]|uniref:Zinc finger PHD-type domain-containing protein n=1 Tax=Liquidambar formosana TaxID=63359 RepID=A0AAP0NF26_LIQFO
MCGAKDNDGERMLACDACGVWQHTRCAGIDSFDAIPTKFVCMRCVNNNCKESEGVSDFSEGSEMVSPSGTTCRDEAIATTGPGVACSLTVVVR